jgi:hypothetical protein
VRVRACVCVRACCVCVLSGCICVCPCRGGVVAHMRSSSASGGVQPDRLSMDGKA